MEALKSHKSEEVQQDNSGFGAELEKADQSCTKSKMSGLLAGDTVQSKAEGSLGGDEGFAVEEQQLREKEAEWQLSPGEGRNPRVSRERWEAMLAPTHHHLKITNELLNLIGSSKTGKEVERGKAGRTRSPWY